LVAVLNQKISISYFEETLGKNDPARNEVLFASQPSSRSRGKGRDFALFRRGASGYPRGGEGPLL
jgi:hypothetical protein